MLDKKLSGSDYFHLLLDRKMLRNGLVGNISRVHLELAGNANLQEMAERLLKNSVLREVAQLKVVHRWPRLPIWASRGPLDADTEEKSDGSINYEWKVSTPYLKIHSHQTRLNFDKHVLNRKVDNDRGLVFIDICELEDRSKHVVISMHHVLFDHQGMMNFLHVLAKETRSFPFFPEDESLSFLDSLWSSVYMTSYMLKRSSSKLGTLVKKDLKLPEAPIFRIITFSEAETEQIEKNAWNAGSRIGQSSFYMAATAQIVQHLITDRNENSTFVWFSVPHNNRKKGSSGHLVSNQLSFLFFKLTADEMLTPKKSVTSINSQLKNQIRDQVIARYSDLLNVLRAMPMPVYEAMVDLASSGKMSSFGFSDLGENKLQLNTFLDAVVVNIFHYPPVPSPPGFNVAVIKENGRLRFVWGYFKAAINQSEIEAMERQFRKILLEMTE